MQINRSKLRSSPPKGGALPHVTLHSDLVKMADYEVGQSQYQKQTGKMRVSSEWANE